MKATLLSLAAAAAIAFAVNTAGAQPPQRQAGPPRDGGDRPRMERFGFNPLLRLFDANQDGTISADEMDGAAAKLKELGQESRRAVVSGRAA